MHDKPGEEKRGALRRNRGKGKRAWDCEMHNEEDGGSKEEESEWR